MPALNASLLIRSFCSKPSCASTAFDDVIKPEPNPVLSILLNKFCAEVRSVNNSVFEAIAWLACGNSFFTKSTPTVS